MIRPSIFCVFLLAASMAEATVYYVATDGNDAHPGTAGQPVRTLAKGMSLAQPGDTVLLGPGYYNEALLSVRDGAPGQYITVDGQGAATVLRASVGNTYHRLQNLSISGHTNRFGSLLNLARGGHYCVVTNVVVDANSAMEVVGISWEGPSSQPFGPDAASNCLLVSNRVTAVLGTTAVSVFGANNRLIGNYIHDVGAADFFRLWGETNLIFWNTFSNNFKVEGIANHVDFIQTFGNNKYGSRGHILDGNRVVKVAGQLSQLEGNVVPEIGYWTFRNNLFIDIDLQASCSIPGVAYYNNVFLRCNQVNGSHVLNFGSRAYTDPVRHHTIGTNYAHGTRVFNNVFLDCGDDRNTRGWYTMSDTITNCAADYNFVAKNSYGVVKQGTAAVGEAGYHNMKWFEYHGINGGNPEFVNVTALDLRPTANSPLIGAAASLNQLFSNDILGVIRGTHWTIGAFQSPSALPPPPPTTPSTPPTTPSTPPTTPSTPPTTPSIEAPRYVVSLNGSDANPGTAEQPFRTIGKAASVVVAGDTVAIMPGDYGEHVYVAASGASKQPIIFRATPPHQAALRAFRLTGSNVVLDGLKFKYYSAANNLWNTATRIEPSAHSITITNCHYTDTPYAIGTDFRFDANGNQIISESSDFIKAGFCPGSKIRLGACGLPGAWYTNHDTMWIIASNTATRLWVTNAAGDAFAPDPGSNYWAAIYAARQTQGFRAIETIQIGGVAADNLRITGNLISNWMGSAIISWSDNAVIENNTLMALNGFRFLDYGGNNLLVRSNLVKDCPNILNFSEEDYRQLPHEDSSNWFDFQVSMFAAESSKPVQTNIVFAYNWFEDIDNQMGRLGDSGPGCYGVTFHNNVFIGVSLHYSGGRDDMRWISNTFYRCAHKTGRVLALGGRPPAQTGYMVVSNLFIDCGQRDGMGSRGWYSVSDNAIDPEADYNMVAGPETTGYDAKIGFDEVHGINGGDPLFLNVNDPLGPDGIPFTNDDGLQVLPHSPAAAIGGGACGVYTPPANQPVAHFRVASPLGWFDPPGEAYDPAWLQLRPWERTNSIRPYNALESLGEAPVQVTFDASGSMSASGNITEYRWTVEGQTVVTTKPTFTHTFTSGGIKPIQLTVVNNLSQTHRFSHLYRVNGSINAPPMSPGNLRLLMH